MCVLGGRVYVVYVVYVGGYMCICRGLCSVKGNMWCVCVYMLCLYVLVRVLYMVCVRVCEWTHTHPI